MKTALATDDPGPDWVPTSQAVAYLGVTVRRLYLLIDRGELRAARQGGRIVVDRSQLDEHLHEG